MASVTAFWRGICCFLSRDRNACAHDGDEHGGGKAASPGGSPSSKN
jgi:hypothetical protein